MDIVLFGIQGSGKGTQAKKILGQSSNFNYLSTGDFFRAVCSSPNPMGDYVKSRINNGLLVPDSFTIAVFHLYLQTLDDNQRILLDGYPRSIAQIDDLIELYKNNGRQIMGINFELSDELAIQRALHRGRSDDTTDKIKIRISEYYKNTKPTIDYFATKFQLVNINADRPIEEVFADVSKIVGV